MKKTFLLNEPGRAPARVVDRVKHEVRKYVRRERGKPLPAGYDLWAFACRVGTSAEAAQPCALGDVSARIDEVVATGSAEVYIEVVAEAKQRPAGTETPVGG